MLPVVAGWGKDAKVIAYLGIIKCSNCRNYDHWQLYEVKKKISAFFVPVAKWGAKYYMVCNVCEAATEIDAAEKEQVLKESVEIPPLETVMACWEALDGAVVKAAEGHAKRAAARSLRKCGTDEKAESLQLENKVNTALVQAGEELEGKYPKPHVEYVCAVYLECLQDEDQPE